MKQVILFAAIAVLGCSCASLYTTPASPTVFLEQKDGAAVQAGIGTNLATNFVSASVTKAVTSEVCLNASATLGLMGNYLAAGNPYVGSKKLAAFAFNAGWNTRRVTVYPIQLWFGINGGASGDSYNLVSFENSFTRDVTINQTDTFFRMQKVTGTYFGTRLALNHILLSNYENDFKLRARKKVRFDIVGTASINTVRYNYSNSDSIKTARNVLVGYATTIRVYKDAWILGLHLDNFVSAKNVTDDLVGNKNPMPLFDQVPLSIPTLSYTFFFGRNKARR
jgi:hypothetical protein